MKYISETEPTWSPVGMDVGYERKSRGRGDSKTLVLSNWAEVVAIY